MLFNQKFLIFLVILFFTSITIVSASDANLTDIADSSNDTFELESTDIFQEEISENNEFDVLKINKSTSTVKISSNKVYSKDTLEIYLQNETGSPIKSGVLTVKINKKVNLLKTNSKGVAKLKINLPANTYKLTISFEGDNNNTSISKSFNIKVYKLKTKITQSANFVVKGKVLYYYLLDSYGNPISGKKITVKFMGKTYSRKTNSKGRVELKINQPTNKYTLTVKFKGDNQFKSSSNKLNIYVTKSRSIKIGNSKLLSNGYLRAYLKVNGKAVSKNVILYIGNKKLIKKSNSEGIVVFKPKVNPNIYNVKVKVGKYYSAKNLKCYKGNVKDPLSVVVPYKNGKPDIDLMPGNYVMGDENAEYTLKSSQYREVLKRDSHCLFLNNKLTKYTFFKTKNHPKLNHIVKREKWNVIEREIYKKLIIKNKHDYWPGEITVSLKNKAYVYPEVRDVQDTGYTCGPTSASVCSQVLKNYLCEKYLAKHSGSKKDYGTSCYRMNITLSKNNFVCEYFYKSTFNYALNELKKGGAALIFHADNHYVAIIDISDDGRYVLVSNSYGTYDGIPTKWVKVSLMKNKFSPLWDDSLIVRLNYKLSNQYKDSINSYYASFGANWHKHNTRQSIGTI